MKNMYRAGLWLLLALSLALPLWLFAQDAEINRDALWHDTHSSLYRTPGGPVPTNSEVILRFRTAASDVDSVALRLYSTRAQVQDIVAMTRVATTPEGVDLWEYRLNTGADPTTYWYRFIVSKGGQNLFYEDDVRRADSGEYLIANEGGVGQVFENSPDFSFQLVVYDPEFYTPEWMRNAIIYQIFPDRFRNGDRSNDPADGSEVFYGRLPLYYHETWNEPMVDGRRVTAPDGQGGWWNSDFYGGDLAGITQQLDYLQALAVSAIYLNPIFMARSNHRYDAADFLQIDPYLGTLEDFRTLVQEARARGILLILDGVFNHMSSDSEYFDRYNRFGTLGACESAMSEYRSWFFFEAPLTPQGACAGPEGSNTLNYNSWFGFDTLPKLNAFDRAARAYFVRGDDSVVRTWMREGIGGWRLDVAGDIDNGRDPANNYWEGFRTVVRFENPEGVIIGEEWGDASEWLLGDEWDASMNYRLRRGILGFVINSDYRDNDHLGDTTIFTLTPTQFDGWVRALAEDTPPMAYHAQMNLLDSHDTSRMPFVVGNDAQLQRLAALTQFTLPGAPTIYYGDEIALDAPSQIDINGALQDDPYNRAPYPWPDESGNFYPAPDTAILAFYQTLGALRSANPALRQGEMLTLLTDDSSGVYAFLRRDLAAGNAALVVLNNSSRAQTVDLNYLGLLPAGLTLTAAFGAPDIVTNGGITTVMLAANSGEVWTVTANGGAFDLPDAPANITAVGETNRISVSWDAVDGAAAYALYRSPVALGGFELLALTGETSYVDEAVTNGFVYHYAVASLSASMLEGSMSRSAFAAPAAPIDRVFLVGAESAVNQEALLFYGLVLNYRAGIAAVGLTDSEGQAAGIQAQAALILAGSAPEDAVWTAMTYIEDQDGADIYEAALMPQAAGTYAVWLRFSTNSGIDWIVVEVGEQMLPQLVVYASDDTTPPDAPAALTIGRATVSGVTLEWSPVPDAGLVAYRVYRTDAAVGEQVQIAELGPDSTTFTDTNVSQGQRLSYAVSAVDDGLNESPQAVTEQVTVERALVAVTIIVTVPEGTPSDPPLQIAGDFRTDAYPLWVNNAPELQMTQLNDTQWSITLFLAEGVTIEFKFVRPVGSDGWGGVEKGPDCEEIANRRIQVVPGPDGTMTLDDLVIAKWRDLNACG